MAKNMKTAKEEMSSWDDDRLKDQILEDEIALKKLHFSHAVNPIENPLAIRKLRRNIARMKTEQRRRTLGL